MKEEINLDITENDLIEEYITEEDIVESEKLKKDENTNLDPVKLYLREITKYSLLTDEQVKECYKYLNSIDTIQILKEKHISNLKNLDLATVFKSCCYNENYELVLKTLLKSFTNLNNKYEKDYFNKIKKYMNLAKEKQRPLIETELDENFDLDFKDAKVLKEKELLLDVENYLKCRNSYNKMFNSNLKLVVSIAKKYKGSYEFLDLINEGNIGLMVAIERFDASLGYKFSTYATPWIKQYIHRTIQSQKHTIRIPTYLQESYYKYKKQVSFLEQKYGRELSEEEISKETGLTVSEIDNLNKMTSLTVSLDKPVSEDSDSEMIDFVESDVNVSKEVMKKMLNEDIVQLFTVLSDREKEVIIRNFGLNETEEKKNLAEIGRELGLTRERIRQIEFKALHKMKNLSRRRNYNFDDYLK